MVAIARGLASDPKILAVDEPCLGLAEAVARRVYDVLARIHTSGTTLIARKCIQTYHASFIVGPESGTDTEAALPIAIANKTILISLSSGWQTNGYPASELNSWGFPGFYDVFAEDQVASVQNLIVPRHYTRVALIEDNCGAVCLANQGTVQALAKQNGFQLESYSQVLAAMEIINPDGSATLFK